MRVKTIMLGTVILGGCPTDKDTPVPVDTDAPTPSVVIPSDGNDSLVDANPVDNAPDSLGPNEVVDLLNDIQSIATEDDRDFFRVTLEAGVPYQFWVDTGANLLCDTVLRIYPPAATNAANDTDQPGDDVIAEADEMIYRWSGSDPGLVFVPRSSGDHTIEILGYNDSIDVDGGGGATCTYMLKGMRRSIRETECNDEVTVRETLDQADTGSPIYPDDVSPIVQEIVPSHFQTYAEEFSGMIDFDNDDDVWRFRFGDLPAIDGGHFWLFSLWPTQPDTTDYPARQYSLTLYDDQFGILAQTHNAIPDGNFGFVEDAGIVYPVTSNSTYYLQVTQRLQDLETPPDTDVPQDTGDTGDSDTDTDVPDTDTDTDTDLPDTDTDTDVPDTDTDTDVPDTDTDTDLPEDTGDTDTDNSDTDLPSDTGLPDTAGTGMEINPSETSDTDTSVDTDTSPLTDTDSAADADTDTDLPDTDVPDTDTDVPDTDTYVPDTDTGVPDTDTTDSDTDGVAMFMEPVASPFNYGWLPPRPGETGPPTYYLGTAHGYGNDLVNCGSVPEDADAPRWVEHEDNSNFALVNNNDFNDAQLLQFCQVGNTDLYVARMWGQLPPRGAPERFERPSADAVDPDAHKACEGGSLACPDRDMFVIRQTSNAGGSIAGRRLTLSIQARSVGSFVLPEIFVFKNNDQLNPIASSYDNTRVQREVELAFPDPVMQFDVPTDAQSLFVLIQPVQQHEERYQANTWFLRAFIEDPPPVTQPGEEGG